jgi:protein-L-isoaspartate O-methyltransferase
VPVSLELALVKSFMLFALPTRRAVLGALAFVCCLGAAAAYEDDILLERDTPYVPTPPDVVEGMLDMAAVRKGEFVIDLGSGDGRVAIAAAKRGARAFGVDLNAELVETAKANAAKAGVADRVSFAVRDLFKTDISKADVLTIYLLPLVNLDLRPRILEQMRPGARVVAHAFHMADWLPDATDNLRGRVIFSWVVPARIAGRWRIESEDGDFTIDVAQAFQKFTATAHVDRRIVPRTIEAHRTQVQDGRIGGAEIVFTVDLGEGPRVFRGRVEDGALRGIAPRGWKGARVR